MVAFKLVKHLNLSCFEKVLIVLRSQCLLYLFEHVKVSTEDDKFAELVVQFFHSRNYCSYQACFSHLLDMD